MSKQFPNCNQCRTLKQDNKEFSFLMDIYIKEKNFHFNVVKMCSSKTLLHSLFYRTIFIGLTQKLFSPFRKDVGFKNSLF